MGDVPGETPRQLTMIWGHSYKVATLSCIWWVFPATRHGAKDDPMNIDEHSAISPEGDVTIGLDCSLMPDGDRLIEVLNRHGIPGCKFLRSKECSEASSVQSIDDIYPEYHYCDAFMVAAYELKEVDSECHSTQKSLLATPRVVTVSYNEHRLTAGQIKCIEQRIAEAVSCLARSFP